MTAVAKLDEIMEKAQEFASTWSLVGGKFDDGTLFATSQERKEELRALVRAALSPAELGGVENPDRYALRMLVAAGWVSESKANEALNIAHGFAKEPLSTPRAAEADWLPIESAPKDGEAILAFWAPRPDVHPYFQTVDGGNYAVAEFREYEWRPSGDDEDTTCWANPTHWRPLPAPPALTPPSAKGE